MYLNKMVYQIWEELEGLHITDDTKFTYDFIKDKLIVWNNTLVGEAYNAKIPLDGFYMIMNGNVVTKVDDTQVIDGITFTKDTGYWTTTPPKLINTVGWNEIIYFGATDLHKNFIRRSINGLLSHDYSRWNIDTPAYARAGDTIVIQSIPNTGFKFASIVGIPIDPTSVTGWDTDDEQDFPTPSPAKLMMLVKKDILSTLGKADVINDAQDKVNVQQSQENKQ